MSTKETASLSSITQPDGTRVKDLPRLTMDQAVVLSVMTGCVLTPMKNVLSDISERLGRPVVAAEFSNPNFIESLKNLYQDDFMTIINPEKMSSLILPPNVK